MKIPSAPASFRTRSDSSSSSVQRNSEVARPIHAFVIPDEPLFLLLSANQAPRFPPEPVPGPSIVTSAPDFIKRFVHRAQCKIYIVRSDRKHRRKPYHVVRVERPVDDHPARQSRRDKSMRQRRIAKLDPDDHPKPAHRSDFRRAHRDQTSHDFLTHRRGAIAQTLAHDHIHTSKTSRARKRMPAERSDVSERRIVRERAKNLVATA